ncbi:MAG: hypothetical protein ACK5QC_12765 [Bacteroidota bacterium]
MIALSLNACRNDANYFIKTTYQSEGLIYILIYFALFSFIPGILLASFVDKYIEKVKYNIYPSVELSIGPNHALINKQKKQKFYFLWTMIVLPAIVSIICNIITSFIN